MPLRLSIATALACRDSAADFCITDFNVLNIRNTSLFFFNGQPLFLPGPWRQARLSSWLPAT